jgi:hypothetical protein
MKTLSEITLKHMLALVMSYDRQLHTPEFEKGHSVKLHIVDRCDSRVSLVVRPSRISSRPNRYTPPSVCILGSATYHARNQLYDSAQHEIARYLKTMISHLDGLVLPDQYIACHVLVKNAYILYEATVPDHVKHADMDGATVPGQPAYKVLAFEVGLLAIPTDSPDDYELVYGEDWDTLAAPYPA